MNTKIKHWLTLLEIFKQELVYSPHENDVLNRILELEKEMKDAVEETK
jgi:hypothetical protein